MDTLPTEILISIFSYLEASSYYDLKLNLPAVCSRFRSVLSSNITRTGDLDIALFRDTPDVSRLPFRDEDDYTTHPAFEVLDYFFTGNLSDVVFTGLNGKRNWKLTDTSVAAENAISPAVNKIHLLYNKAYVDEIENPGGVKVLDVINSVVEFFNDAGTKFWGFYKWSGMIYVGVESGGKVIMVLGSFERTEPPAY